MDLHNTGDTEGVVPSEHNSPAFCSYYAFTFQENKNGEIPQLKEIKGNQHMLGVLDLNGNINETDKQVLEVWRKKDAENQPRFGGHS